MVVVKLALAIAATLMAACGTDPTMRDYAEAYAEAVISHAEGCGPLTSNREKAIDFIVESTCAVVDCDAPASGDLDACLEAVDAKSCNDPLAPAACVAMWY